MAKLRCTVCHDYHPAEDAYRKMGLGSVCSEACFLKMRDGRSAKRVATMTALPGVTDETRKAVRRRDQNRCRRCGGGSGLAPHHVVYRSQGGGHTETNLILLCVDCHALVHSDKGRWMPVCQAYLRVFYGEGRQLSFAVLRAKSTPTDRL